MTSSDRGPASVQIAAQHEKMAVAEWLGHFGLQGQATDEIQRHSFIVARQENQLIGAVSVHIRPGRSGVLVGPRIAETESDALAHRLISAALDQFTDARTVVALALLSIDQQRERDWIIAAGFSHEVVLDYLIAGAKPLNVDSFGRSNFHRDAYHEGRRGELAEIIERTYQGSLDCPVLNGLRCSDDTIEDYRATGTYMPGNWHFLRQNNEDVGCLLLADHPQEELFELLYMGIVPEARGQGMGHWTIGQALGLTAIAGRRHLRLAVDASNKPAQQVYANAGFIRWDQKRILMRAF